MRRLAWLLVPLLVVCLAPVSTAAPSATVTVTARPVERRGEGLFLVGTVEPASRVVWVQRATRCDRATRTCRFTFYRRVEVTADGRWESRISVPPSRVGWVYRAKAGTSFSSAWLTCTKPRRTDRCWRPS